MSITLDQYLTLSAILLAIGIYGLLTRRNAVGLLMSTEIILNSVNLNLVAFNSYLHPAALAGRDVHAFHHHHRRGRSHGGPGPGGVALPGQAQRDGRRHQLDEVVTQARDLP